MRLELVGLSEVADVLDVSKRTAARYVIRGDFPEPVARLRSGPIWLEAEVRAWARNSPAAKPGRPLKVVKTPRIKQDPPHRRPQ